MKMFACVTSRLLAGLLMVNSLLCSPAAAIIFDELQSVNVWLTISSLASKDPNDKANFLFRQIELNWINAPLNEGDYIALYLDSEPEQASDGPASLHRPSNMSGKLVLHDHHLPVIDFYAEQLARGPNWEPAASGPRGEQIEVASLRRAERRHDSDRWHRHRSLVAPTSGHWPARRHDDELELEEPQGQSEATRAGLMEECVGYCVAYHSQHKILAKSCLRTQPNWMRDVKVGSRAITSIAIAGTHNSGTYLQQRPSANKIDKSVLQLINKYQLNQEENIFNQLVYGIRYLDLRVGYSKVKNRHEELWIYHDIFRTDNSLNEVLEQVERFLELAPSEVLVMDFHRFTVGFQNENAQVERKRHEMVLELLYKTLGKFIVPSYLGQNAPLGEYIGLNKRLFVGYAGRSRLMNQMHHHHHQRLQLGQNLGSREQMLAHESSDKRREMEIPFDGVGLDSARNYTLQSVSRVSEGAEDDQNEQDSPDRRIGTRVYNRLKSLKLISRSFSKRSIEFNQANNRSPGLSKRANVYKSKQRSPNFPVEQSLKMMQTLPPAGGLSMMAEQSFHSKLSLLFNAVHHVWPNTDKEDSLRQFIEQSACRKYHGELNSLMAELTPTVFGAISDKYDGVRRLSSQTNRMVGDLIRSKFLHCINLVATDYFLGNDLIRLSIYANKMRQHLDKSLDLDPRGECRSFRRIKPLLLRKWRESDSNQHQSSSVSSTSANVPSSLYQADGISDLFGSFFRRIFNL